LELSSSHGRRALICRLSQIALNWSVKDGANSVLRFEWEFGHNDDSGILKSSRLSEGMRMPRATITSDDLRRFAVARSLFLPTTLRRAIARLVFS